MKQLRREEREKNSATDQVTCRFCDSDASTASISNDHASVKSDGIARTPGHTPIVPQGHTASFFDASSEEPLARFDLMADMRRLLPRSTGSYLGEAEGAGSCPPRRRTGKMERARVRFP